MFRVMLFTQWKWSRLIILFGTLAAFALPIISLQGAASADRSPLEAQDLLRTVQSWGTLYPVLAAALGLFVAMAAWAPDHRGRHVHALTLPLPRWRYVLLRCAGGALLLAIPAAAVLAGALLATATATLPPGLQSYPFALATHFVLATAVAYGVFFAVSAATARTAGIILAAVGALIAVQVVAGVANVNFDIVSPLTMIVLGPAGPFAIFTGRWMLVDV